MCVLSLLIKKKCAYNDSEYVCMCLLSVYVHAFQQLHPRAHTYVYTYIHAAVCSQNELYLTR